MKPVIACIVDRDSFFEIGPDFARMIIVGFARVAGQSVGIIANQAIVQAGAITTASARKMRHFIDLCTAYHIPMLFLEDMPGVMPGPLSEREGILRAGLSVAYALAWSDVKVTIVLRKAFGFDAVAMGGGGASGQTLVLRGREPHSVRSRAEAPSGSARE